MNWMTISEVTRKVPTSNGKPVGTATVWRWITKGCKGVKLEHARFGRRIAISEEALDRFGIELSRTWAEAKPNKPVPKRGKTKPRTKAQREQAIAEAETALRKRGILGE